MKWRPRRRSRAPRPRRPGATAGARQPPTHARPDLAERRRDRSRAHHAVCPIRRPPRPRGPRRCLLPRRRAARPHLGAGIPHAHTGACTSAFMRTRVCAPKRNHASTTAPRRCLSTSTTCRRPCRLTRHAPRCTHCAQPAPPQQPCPASQVTDIPCGTSGGTVIQFDRIEVVNQLKREMVHATVSPRPSDSPRHDQASTLRARSRAVRIRAGEELHDRVRQDVDLR